MGIRRSTLRSLLVITGLLIAGGFLACGGGGSNPPGGSETQPTTPVLSLQPQSQAATEGATVSLSVAASANGTLSYQWKKGTTNVGSNSASLSFNPVALTDAGTYTVVVTNTLNGSTASVTSSAATLTVNPKASVPTIGTQPASATVTEGTNATLSVAATVSDGGTLSYQWKKGTTNVGTNANSLAFTPAALTDAGTYTVVVTNTLNGTTATATSNTATLTVTPAASGPVINVHPTAKAATVPDSATFTVDASASGTITYQWRKNGTAITTNGNGASYTTPATSLQELSATYTVDVTANGITVTSNPASLTVNQPDPCYAGDPTAQASLGAVNVWEYVTTYSSRGAYRLGYHETLMNPLWTAYCTYTVASPFTTQGSRTYVADPRSTAAVGDSDFSNTGYTRGHMVTMSDMELRYGGPAGTTACITTNLCPQIAEHNNNLWNSLEQDVFGAYSSGTWTKPGLFGTSGRMWVYTGPVFTTNPVRRTGDYLPGDPTKLTTGKHMALPDGFYKIMVKEVAGKPTVLAILTPHEPTPAFSTIQQYTTSIARIEELTKLNLFPNLSGTASEIQAFKETVDVRGWGSNYENTSKPNVHMIEPSWDFPASVGVSCTFRGAYSSSNSTVSSVSWDFGDGGTASTPTATHAYAANGTYNVKFTATDGLGVSNSITRVVTVTGGNIAPTISTIGNQTTAQDTAKAVNFTIADDSTPVGSLVVAVHSTTNTTLLPDDASHLALVNDGAGNCSLTLTPATGQTGTARVTVTVTDGGGAATSQNFDLTVSSGGGPGQPILIISQYYENNTTGRLVEITNIGTAKYDSTGSTKYYLGLLANPFNSSGGSYSTLQLVQTLQPGASVVYSNTATPTTPPVSAISGTPVVSTNVTTFNGDDILYLSTNGTAGAATSWAARTDVLGVNAASWTGTSTTSANTSAAAGYRTSWVRNAAVVAANPTFTLTEWTKVTTATVDAAQTGDTNRLGEHVYTH